MVDVLSVCMYSHLAPVSISGFQQRFTPLKPTPECSALRATPSARYELTFAEDNAAMGLFHDLWILNNISVLEKIIRPILVYFFLLIALRLGGKRELGQMTGFDLVVLLMLSNAVQNAIIGDDNSVSGGMIGAAALLITNYITVRLAYRYPKIEHLVEGKSTLLVNNGRIIHENLDKEVITEAELRTSLRRQGFEDLVQIKAAILETSGSLSVERQTADPESDYQREILDRLRRIEVALHQRADTH